jgi:anti-sigma factor RsiW
MTDHILELLDDYVDDELSPADAERVKAHLAGCAECAGAEQRLRKLLSAAAALPESIEPPAEVWSNIQSLTAKQLAQRPQRNATVGNLWSLRYPLAAAAVVLIIASSTITALLLKRNAPAAAPTPNAVTLVALDAAEREYVRISGELEAALNRHANEIDPATIKTVRENLVIMDRAIAEARAALKKTPGDAELSRLVSTGYRRKIGMLERTLRLSAGS